MLQIFFTYIAYLSFFLHEHWDSGDIRRDLSLYSISATCAQNAYGIYLVFLRINREGLVRTWTTGCWKHSIKGAAIMAIMSDGELSRLLARKCDMATRRGIARHLLVNQTRKSTRRDGAAA